MPTPPDEFEWIDRLRPLSRGDPRALGLKDDAAVIPHRPGHELVISTDAMVEGVHFLVGQPLAEVARRLLRASFSDLAAKAAEPFGYFLMTAWPADRTWADREAFIAGLGADGEALGVNLLGGDTVGTSGPLTLCATALGWSPTGGAVLRSGARPGDVAVVFGPIGDGWLGLAAARGEIADPTGALAAHYRTPPSLFALRDCLRTAARAAADVSDGLLADAGHVADASGLGVRLELADLPLSPEAAAWLAEQPDDGLARLALATGGDDYAIICAIEAGDAAGIILQAHGLGVTASAVGIFEAEAGLTATLHGEILDARRLGWRH